MKNRENKKREEKILENRGQSKVYLYEKRLILNQTPE